MKFCVCIKQVPDVSAPIQVRDGTLTQDTDRMVLDAYSASAVEQALVMAGDHGGDVQVVLVGPGKARETIRKAIAMGAESGVHIQVDDAAGIDSAAYATILAAWFEKQEYDAILTGKQSQDTDAGLTGGMLAAKLGLPYAANAVGLDYDPDSKAMIVRRQGDTGQEVIQVKTPCLVTCSNDMNDPRIPGLKGIMQSKKKQVDEVSLEDLGLSRDTLRMGTTVTGYENLPMREPGKKLEGEADEIAAQLVNLLDNEAKVI
jgi:electron transfer flavoprotein beta subunit